MSSSTYDVQRLPMADADVELIPALFSASESDVLFQRLMQEIDWKQVSIRLFGKSVPVPRLTAWHGDPNAVYTYSHLELRPQPWTASLLDIRQRLTQVNSASFNSVLLNLYRGGADSMGWHADDEPELGPEPVIASVSLGETRRFQFRHRFKKTEKVSLDLESGSCLLMAGPTQMHWQHQVPKTRKACGPRINLTFRYVDNG